MLLMLEYNMLLFNYESSNCRQKNDINKTNLNHNKKTTKSIDY